jgi:hypothetical protein
LGDLVNGNKVFTACRKLALGLPSGRVVIYTSGDLFDNVVYLTGISSSMGFDQIYYKADL